MDYTAEDLKKMTSTTAVLVAAQIKTEARRKAQSLKRSWAFANTPYKVGDIVEDHFHRIQITKIVDYYEPGNGGLGCIFKGIQLTKQNQPRKNQEYTSMYEGNIKFKINLEDN